MTADHALVWHLRHNVFPPAPEGMHDACADAIRACADGEPERIIPIDAARAVIARELVEAFRLAWFVEDNEGTNA